VNWQKEIVLSDLHGHSKRAVCLNAGLKSQKPDPKASVISTPATQTLSLMIGFLQWRFLSQTPNSLTNCQMS
jgi:hypothetical protein